MSLRWMAALCMACVCLAQAPPKVSKKAPTKSSETFLQWLVRVTGLSATSASFKGGTAEVAGDIWVGRVDQAGGQRLTFEGGWSWPVFAASDEEIVAVREGVLWSIPVNGGDPVKLPHSLKGVKGLLGAGIDGVVVFTDSQIGLFQPDSGSLVAFEAGSAEDQANMARAQRPREMDLKVDGEKAVEPSVSHDGKRIVYIRGQ